VPQDDDRGADQAREQGFRAAGDSHPAIAARIDRSVQGGA
jgi:hypothetical protein